MLHECHCEGIRVPCSRPNIARHATARLHTLQHSRPQNPTAPAEEGSAL
jgi:hypothetical protein